MIVILAGAALARGWRHFFPPPKKFDISIISQPAGATIFLNEKHIGVTPRQAVRVWEGEHSLKLQKRGFLPWRMRIKAVEGLDVIRARLVPAGKGVIVVNSEPAQCEVHVDGQKQGITPLRLEKIPVGLRQVRLSRPGFMPVVREIVVEADQETKLSVKLQSKTEEYIIAQARLNPKDLVSLIEVLHLYIVGGKLDKAKGALAAALSLWNAETADADTLGRLEEEIRKAYFAEYNLGGDAALEAVRLALESGLSEAALGPSRPSARAGLLLGRLFEGAERFDKARVMYEQLLAKQAGDIDVKRAYGLLLFRLQQMPEAVKHLAEVAATRPGDSEVHRYLAAGYMNLQKNEDALKVLLHAAGIEGLPAQEKIAFETQAAGLLHAQGRFAEAAERWEKAWPVGESAEQQAELQLAAAMEHNLGGNKKRAHELYNMVLAGGAAAGLKDRARQGIAN